MMKQSKQNLNEKLHEIIAQLIGKRGITVKSNNLFNKQKITIKLIYVLNFKN